MTYRLQQRARGSDLESGNEEQCESAPSPDAGEASLRAADIAFLAGVPLVLLGVFALPVDVRLSLSLSSTRPSVLTMYTAHFVHLNAVHLLSNLLVFLIVVPFSLLGSLQHRRRRRFYVVAATILLVFPFAFSALNLLFPRPRIGMGFSGMNLAFVGYLPHVLADRFDADRPSSVLKGGALSPVAFFFGTAVIAGRTAQSAGLSLGANAEYLLAGGAGLFAAGVGSILAVGLFVRPVLASVRLRDVAAGTVPPVLLFGTLLFVPLVLVSFPYISPAGGVQVNVFLHFLGYSFGYIVPYVAFWVLGIDLDAPGRALPQA